MTEQDYIPDWYIPPMSDRDKMKFTTWHDQGSHFVKTT